MRFNITFTKYYTVNIIMIIIDDFHSLKDYTFFLINWHSYIFVNLDWLYFTIIIEK